MQIVLIKVKDRSNVLQHTAHQSLLHKIGLSEYQCYLMGRQTLEWKKFAWSDESRFLLNKVDSRIFYSGKVMASGCSEIVWVIFYSETLGPIIHGNSILWGQHHLSAGQCAFAHWWFYEHQNIIVVLYQPNSPDPTLQNLYNVICSN